MSTASTKQLSLFSRDNPPSPGVFSKRGWFVATFVVMAVAVLLRVSALELKPLHHDEGINGFFLTNLLRQGVYKYDPTNYHGPTLYYLAVPLEVLLGLSAFAIRLLPALFGVAIVWLALSLKRYIGDAGALAAGALIAVSPGAVFYSRYFIHETLFVFFTLGIVAAALRFHETGKVRDAMLVAASAAMLFATKETAFISAGTLGIAWLVANVWAYGGKWADRDAVKPTRVFKLVAGAAAVFIAINVIFYSSLFTNWRGLIDAVQALIFWSSTGASEFHGKPITTYFLWLVQEEAPILILGVIGCVAALATRPANRFAIFTGAWAFGMFAAYSLIPYKTPWLALNFIVPLAIAGGYAVHVLLPRARTASVLVVAGAAVLSLFQTLILNFREYDNDRYPYVYSQTRRETLAMLSEIERTAERAGTKQIGVTIASPEHWPLPWYFRDNPRVGFPGTVYAGYDPNDTPVVIGSEDQAAKLGLVLGEDYKQVGTYDLRPGVRLVLFVRRDLS